MLTIAEFARYAGVSVRTVRHYHQIGLLPEPPRDELGHRRYDARALIELRRIRTLADAGVPLNRITAILTSDAQDWPALLAEVDAELRRHQAELRRTRQRLHALRAGRDAELPDGVVTLMARLRALGCDQSQLDVEREVWLLTHLLYPDLTEAWLEQQLRLLDDPQYTALYLEVLRVRDWDPADPRLVDLAARNVDWTLSHAEEYGQWVEEWERNPRAVELLEAHTRYRYGSPAHRRLQTLIQQMMPSQSTIAATQPASSSGML
ncbi:MULTISPECIES: MerR family transcriptional regulator [unclassified Luteococcus]|uniref:MerR family transcriptional regulator n=1 Tax=unclassified Luteococcus TaxID=2639923 RepID=UPI00313E9DFE